METELDILRDLSHRLESAGIAFMLTGSVAMNYYAQPRMTRDIDLVLALGERDVEKFVQLFQGDFYLDRQAVSRAITMRSLFNLIHNRSVIKVDCIVLKGDAYRQEEFSRRRQISLGDFRTWIVSREDLILSKLYWVRNSNEATPQTNERCRQKFRIGRQRSRNVGGASGRDQPKKQAMYDLHQQIAAGSRSALPSFPAAVAA